MIRPGTGTEYGEAKITMLKRSLFILLAVLFATGFFVAGYAIGQSKLAPVQLFSAPETTPDNAVQAFRPFWETWQFLHDEYFEQPLDNVQLAEGAIEGMLAVLDDPNTRYLSPAQELAARQTFDGNIEGIGAEVTEEDGVIVIVAPYEGSPAESAGLRTGDILLEADGIALSGMSVAEAASLVRGPAGTTVRLLILRDGDQFEVDVVRDVIDIPSVRGEILEENLAYVRLNRFANDTADELEAVLKDLGAAKPSGMILDLRGNPGGGLQTAIDVADQFLDEGTILLERFGNGSETVHKSRQGGQATDIPLVVLIDQGSASASEVLAGAIRDSDRGILIGTSSFGKGTVQTWKQLSNGGGVRITIARWLTPDEYWVHESGLVPDFIVEFPEDFVFDGDFTDIQLQAAIDYLLGRPVTETTSAEEG